MLEATTAKMRSELESQGARLDGVYYCLHHRDALLEEYRVSCNCRKPKPGLLLRAAGELGIDLSRSYVVVDGIMDIAAGQSVGATTLFISSRKCYVCAELER